jgi:hypothetical protein
MDHGCLCGSGRTAVGQAAEHPAPDPAWIVPGLGEAVMVQALLVARVAALVSAGRSTADVVGLLADSGVLAGPGVESERLSGLVGTVRRRLTFIGIGDSVLLLGCGLRAWNSLPTRESGTCSHWTLRERGHHETQIRRTAGRQPPLARAPRRTGCPSCAGRNDRQHGALLYSTGNDGGRAIFGTATSDSAATRAQRPVTTALLPTRALADVGARLKWRCSCPAMSKIGDDGEVSIVNE